MKKLIVIVFFGFSITITAQQINITKLDSLCKILNESEKLLGGIYISKAGDKVFEYEFKGDGKYKGVTRIGSITKIYTAVLIMQLVEEGKLTLEDKLGKYFPKIDGSNKISILQMLTHKSGIYSFDNDYTLGDTESWIYKPQTKEEMLNRFYKYKLQFEPGSKTSYSNTAYSLLGYIIEMITQSSYEENLDKRICKRLNLINTFCNTKVDTTRNQSYSFVKDNGWVAYPSSDLSGAAAGSAGCISSTPNEVAKFYDAFFSGKLISKQSIYFMTENRIGWNKDKLTETQFGWGHLGSIDAYFNSATYNQTDSTCFVFLFNGMAYPFADVFFKTIDISYNQPTKLPSFKEIRIELEQLLTFEGKYKLRTGDIIEIKRIDKNLHFIWEVNGYGNFKLCPISETTFIYDTKGLTLKFGYDKDKNVDKLTMYQGKQTIRMDKIK